MDKMEEVRSAFFFSHPVHPNILLFFSYTLPLSIICFGLPTLG